MQPEKKQLEILLINYFRERFEDFPRGELNESESPDFIVMLKNRHQLGIELTRLFPENAVLPDSDQLVRFMARDRLVSLARELVEKDLPHHLFVKFLFSDDEELQPETELVTAARIAGIVRREISSKSTESFFRMLLTSKSLPKGIDRILIVNHPAMTTSVWERSNRFGITNNVVEDIRYAIQKKEEKLQLYQKQRLNYYWLLILADRLQGIKNFNLQNKIQNLEFSSRFQHVYLFDLMKCHIFELV